MYTSLYRRERPEVFDQVIGQEHVVKVLKYQIENNRINHAYLFCGTRGTGKTTAARLLAKAVNCLSEDEKPCGACANCRAIQDGNFLDVIEIDAASNNGVDNIRELRESVNYPPSQGRKKVYIIDEVHMLTKSGFNALLKTLEEPPEDVMFILATTDPQMMPATVLSRCIRLDFRRVSDQMLYDKLVQVCENEDVSYEEAALRLVVSCADGSVRDCLSLMEQVLSAGGKSITKNDVLEMLGIVADDYFLKLTEYVIEANVREALTLIQQASDDGKDMKQLLQGWLTHMRNLLICQFSENVESMLGVSAENGKKLKVQSKEVTTNDLDDMINILAKTIYDSKYSMNARVMVEVALVKLCELFGGVRERVVQKSLCHRQGEALMHEKLPDDNIDARGNNKAVHQSMPLASDKPLKKSAASSFDNATSDVFFKTEDGKDEKTDGAAAENLGEDVLPWADESVDKGGAVEQHLDEPYVNSQTLKEPPSVDGYAHRETLEQNGTVAKADQGDRKSLKEKADIPVDDVKSFEPSKINREKLWKNIVDETQKIDKTSSFLLQGVEIVELTDTYCRCAVSSPVKEKLLKKHEKLVIDALKKLVGTPLEVLIEGQNAKTHHITAGELNRLSHGVNKADKAEGVRTAEKVADEMKNKFGMDIEIEE